MTDYHPIPSLQTTALSPHALGAAAAVGLTELEAVLYLEGRSGLQRVTSLRRALRACCLTALWASASRWGGLTGWGVAGRVGAG